MPGTQPIQETLSPSCKELVFLVLDLSEAAGMETWREKLRDFGDKTPYHLTSFHRNEGQKEGKPAMA
jgi:hypothetical protein